MQACLLSTLHQFHNNRTTRQIDVLFQQTHCSALQMVFVFYYQLFLRAQRPLNISLSVRPFVSRITFSSQSSCRSSQPFFDINLFFTIIERPRETFLQIQVQCKNTKYVNMLFVYYFSLLVQERRGGGARGQDQDRPRLRLRHPSHLLHLPGGRRHLLMQVITWKRQIDGQIYR